MSNLCRDLKIEYESLKTLNQEFFSACEKAGDPRALSADRLRALQIQKQRLEKARNILKEKLENRLWKKVWNDALQTPLGVEPFRGTPIKEFIVREEFVVEIIRIIEDHLTVATYPSVDEHSFIRAITTFHAARGLDLLSKDDQEEIWKRINSEEFREKVIDLLRLYIRRSTRSPAYALLSLSGLHAARELGCFNEDTWNDMRDIADASQFQGCALKAIQLKLREWGAVNEDDILDAVRGLSAIMGSGLFTKQDIEGIQKEMSTSLFQFRCVKSVQSRFARCAAGVAKTKEIEKVVQALNATRELSKRVRKRS